VTGDDHTWFTYLGDQCVTRPPEFQVWKTTESSFKSISDHVLVMGLARDIDEGGCNIDYVSRQINARGHVDTVAA
jgi:hypothetical protein